MNSLSFFSRACPGFAVRGDSVRVINEPSEFYSEVLARAAAATRRITLAALYLGTGETERALVDTVAKRAEEEPVRVRVMLDFCRGTRVDDKGQSSCSLLQKLIERDATSCRVSLYHTPALRGLWKRFMPQRWNETVGLQHCKVYIFDDSIIISGANLNKDYFTNRQDRYVLIKDCPKLADYFDELVETISGFSLQQRKDGSFSLDETWSCHPFEGSYSDFVSAARDRVSRFLNRQLERNRLDFEPRSDAFVSAAANADAALDTWIFPSVQMGLFGIDHDQRLTTELLQSAPPGSSFKFGTGYFNPTEDYLRVILEKSQASFDVLMAHPEANGFYKASGMAGGIPDAYTLISQQFLTRIRECHASDRIRLFEYRRPNWTFHGKGLWHYLPGCDLPSATMVGSPNFGYRSVSKDLEAQIAIVTKNDALRQSLHREQERLFQVSHPATEEVFSQPDRKVPAWVKVVVKVARSFF